MAHAGTKTTGVKVLFDGIRANAGYHPESAILRPGVFAEANCIVVAVGSTGCCDDDVACWNEIAFDEQGTSVRTNYRLPSVIGRWCRTFYVLVGEPRRALLLTMKSNFGVLLVS
jgi:hypothetical protein